MLNFSVSLASAIAWFGLFLTLVGLALTVLGLISNHKSNKTMYLMQNAITQLQNGALQQLLRQHDKMINKNLGDFEADGDIVTNEESSSKNGT